MDARIFVEGETAEPVSELASEAEAEERYTPEPVWGTSRNVDRKPTSEEVEARKVLLSGDLAMWLDEGSVFDLLIPMRLWVSVLLTRMC